jgi:8-oxo-(d)GTP phosphatase
MTIVLLRHASAGDRISWGEDDMLRPLDRRGRAQATALRDALLGRGVTLVLSSPYVRCTETVAPLAASLGVAIEVDDRLAEGAGGAGARALLAERDGCVACTHGDITEELLGRTLKKGAAALVTFEGNELRLIETMKAP